MELWQFFLISNKGVWSNIINFWAPHNNKLLPKPFVDISGSFLFSFDNTIFSRYHILLLIGSGRFLPWITNQVRFRYRQNKLIVQIDLSQCKLTLCAIFITLLCSCRAPELWTEIRFYALIWCLSRLWGGVSQPFPHHIFHFRDERERGRKSPTFATTKSF